MTPDNDLPTQNQKTESKPAGLAVWKKILFAGVAVVLFFGLLEGALAIFGVEPRSYEEDPYVGFSGYAPLFVEATSADGPAMMERAPDKAELFNMQRFRRQKPDGVTRVFCVGGSTTYGRPYGDVTSFCGWLRAFLEVAEPDRRWEVINAGGISYASYRVAVLMEELIEYDPDLFIIYTGHNEFLERRTYPQIIAMPRAVRGVGAVASKTRTWTAIEGVVNTVRGGSEGRQDEVDTLGTNVVTLLDDAVGPSAYTRDDELRDKVLDHFRFNLDRMVEIARSVGAEVLMVTPASNLRDSGPFKSENRDDLNAAEQAEGLELTQQGAEAAQNGDLEGAAELLQRAVWIDGRHADLQFMLGRVLYRLERFDEARAAFEAARDEDVCPLRALGPVPGIVREVAAEHGVPVVDFAEIVDQASENRIPGNNLFLDHLHPTIDGNRLLALALLDAMVGRGWANPSADWGETAVQRVTEQVTGGLDATAHALALTNLSKVIGWAGKLGESYVLARRAVALDPEDIRVQYQAGVAADMVGRVDEAMEHYRKAIEIQPGAALPHGNLAVALEKKGMMDEAVENYRIAYQNSTPEMLDHHRENYVNGLVKAGFMAYNQGQADEARALLTEADTIRPGDPQILSRLGTVLMATGRADQAAEKLRLAAQQRPGDAGARNRLALALALAGRPAEAATQYSQALAMDPAITQSPENLFTVLERMGNNALAAEVRRNFSP
jgi:tetratricopeptide (TPR) repeat protein